MTEPAPLQKHELLRKLLNMTTSANDAEALIALRKANQLLVDQKWSWDLLLAAKIRVVGDPWSGAATPPKPQPQTPRSDDSAFGFTRPSGGASRTAPRPKAQPTYSSPPPPPPPRPAPPPPPRPTIASTRSNGFSGHCYCCGTFVPSGAGYIFKPGASGWEVVCDPCNKSSAPVPIKRAKRRTATTSDILSGL